MKMKLVRNFNLVKDDFNGFEAKQAMLIADGLIQWIGPEKKLGKQSASFQEIDLKGQNILPAFIECHTHSLFAGSRADEFELRNTGVSYQEIAKRGGGILSTMAKTRKATAAQLLQSTTAHVKNFLAQGVATVEIKSGYALDLKNEIKSLSVIQQVADQFSKKNAPQIISTFLGAHAKPPEFASYSQYLDFLIANVLPVIKKKKLSQRVDIFIESGFFEASDSKKYLLAAQALGFQVVIHANQLSLSGGAELALDIQALSADHVIHLTDQTIKKFSQSKKTVAVLLPTADLYMRCPYPQARKLIEAGATVALATDFNPGSCPSQDLSLVGLLARLEMKMTLPEVFKAYTLNAAKALNIETIEGSLHVGKRANFISTHADLADFFYSAGQMPKHDLFIRGTKSLG